MSQCRDCRAQILWVTTSPGGRRMPIDPRPVTAAGEPIGAEAVLGELYEVAFTSTPPVATRFAPALRFNPPGPLYTSHRETCRSRR